MLVHKTGSWTSWPRNIFSLVIAIGMIVGCYAADQRLTAVPTFENLRVKEIFKGVPEAPRFDSDEWPIPDPRFQDAVRLSYKSGPNFAGHLTIVNVSCGSGCVYLAVIDSRAGKIFARASEVSLIVGRYQDKTGKMFTYTRFSYRLDSRLLIAEGCFDGANWPPGPCERRYYVWQQNYFRLLREVRIKQPQ